MYVSPSLSGNVNGMSNDLSLLEGYYGQNLLSLNVSRRPSEGGEGIYLSRPSIGLSSVLKQTFKEFRFTNELRGGNTVPFAFHTFSRHRTQDLLRFFLPNTLVNDRDLGLDL